MSETQIRKRRVRLNSGFLSTSLTIDKQTYTVQLSASGSYTIKGPATVTEQWRTLLLHLNQEIQNQIDALIPKKER